MLYLRFLLLLLLWQVEKNISTKQDQFCQVTVIRECLDHLLGLLKAIETGNGRLLMEKCGSLQATIDCFSFPRCHGILSQAFRYFVLTTATILKKTSYACPNLDINILERNVKGFTMICEGNKRVKDLCERRCKCQDGKLVSCYRVRKEFIKMRKEERTRFINTFKLVSSDLRYTSELEKLGKLHSIVPRRSNFFPWHRWFVLEFENLLRQVDCRITIPYWNWCRDAEHWTRGSELEDTWNSGPHGLGGNGVFPYKCVMDGPVKMSEYSLPQDASGFCLKRNFNYSCNLENKEEAENLVNEANFTVFLFTMFYGFHQRFHQCVGETLADFRKAPYSPEFWLLHSFLDKLWVDWQRNNKNNKFAFYPSVNYFMYGTEQYPWEYVEADQLPGDVHVLYEQ